MFGRSLSGRQVTKSPNDTDYDEYDEEDDEDDEGDDDDDDDDEFAYIGAAPPRNAAAARYVTPPPPKAAPPKAKQPFDDFDHIDESSTDATSEDEAAAPAVSCSLSFESELLF